MRIIPTILAGGVGERLWPLSQAQMPKQFVVRDATGHSLFQATVLRVNDRTQFSAPLVLCNHAHRFLVRAQLRAIGVVDASILIEPESRNTAPAIALAAMQVASQTSDALMLMMPSDHQMDDVGALLQAVTLARGAAQAGHLITFGVRPTSPETGYGYIHYGAAFGAFPPVRMMDRFIEKPDRLLAETLIKAGDYGWNSGIFFASCTALLAEYRSHASAIYDACLDAYDARLDDHGFIRPEDDAFGASPAIAFDYAIMEQTERGGVIPVEMGWRDLGSWAALDAVATKDSKRNAVQGEASLRDVENCFIHAESRHVAAVGLRDLVVIESNGHVLVAPKSRSLEAKAFAKETYVNMHSPQVTHRPWGKFASIDHGDDYQVKKLCIEPGEKISLQVHRARSEHWVVVSGTATVTCGEKTFALAANESTYIAAGQRHRLENHTNERLVVIEVQTGDYFGEDDIERFADAYDRVEA